MYKPISFKLAKVLKEKLSTIEEYIHSLSFYADGELVNDRIGKLLSYDACAMRPSALYEKSEITPAPTIADVVMWLYYEHNIWISVSIIPYEKHVMFEYGICTVDESLHQDGVFNSPNEAYEAAIEYTLNYIL